MLTILRLQFSFWVSPKNHRYSNSLRSAYISIEHHIALACLSLLCQLNFFLTDRPIFSQVNYLELFMKKLKALMLICICNPVQLTVEAAIYIMVLIRTLCRQKSYSHIFIAKSSLIKKGNLWWLVLLVQSPSSTPYYCITWLIFFLLTF